MANQSQKFTRGIRAAVLSACMLGASFAVHTASIAPAQAESGVVHITASIHSKTVKVAKAKPKTVRTDMSFSEIVVGDPDVARVTPLTDRSFYIVGN